MIEQPAGDLLAAGVERRLQPSRRQSPQDGRLGGVERGKLIGDRAPVDDRTAVGEMIEPRHAFPSALDAPPTADRR